MTDRPTNPTTTVRAPIPRRWSAPEAELAILVISARRARLLLIDGATIVEVTNGTFPVHGSTTGHGRLDPPAQTEAARLSYGWRVIDALRTATRDRIPIVVAGEPQSVATFAALARNHLTIDHVISGDHDHTSPTVLRGLARRSQRKGHRTGPQAGAPTQLAPAI